MYELSLIMRNITPAWKDILNGFTMKFGGTFDSLDIDLEQISIKIFPAQWSKAFYIKVQITYVPSNDMMFISGAKIASPYTHVSEVLGLMCESGIYGQMGFNIVPTYEQDENAKKFLEAKEIVLATRLKNC